MTETPPDADQEYRPQTKFASCDPEGQNEIVEIPNGAIAVSVEFDEGPIDGGTYIIEYLEPVNR